MQYRLISDDNLVDALMGGEKNALTEIVKRHWKPLYEEALSKVRIHQHAEDIVLQLFQELWDKKHMILEPGFNFSRLKTFLDAEIKNKVLYHLMGQSVSISRVRIWNIPPPKPAPEAIEYQLQKRIKFSH